MKTSALYLAALALALTGAATADEGSDKKMKEPETTEISGVLIDMSCAAKGLELMDSEHNAVNDTHMTPNGEMQKCATMCLRGGQPAGLWKDGKIHATLLANPSLNLYEYAAKEVEIQGWYAGQRKDKVKTFVPVKIREKGDTEWTEVQTAEMH